MTPRTRWLIVALVSLIATVASVFAMSQRVRAFHERNPRETYVFRQLLTPEFQYAGREVSLSNDLTNPQLPMVVLRYGDQEVRIRNEFPNWDNPGRDALPGLVPYDRWLKVLRMAKVSGMTPQAFLAELDAGKVPDRLVVVTRVPLPGSDPATWGSVWKKDWSFDFYELMPDGMIRREPRLGYPTTRGIKPPRDGELHENTWQFQAALQLMPQAGGIGPTHNFFGNGVAAAGWTLPVAAFAGLVFTISAVFALAPLGRSEGAKKRGSQAGGAAA